jgi:hypothetical protein
MFLTISSGQRADWAEKKPVKIKAAAKVQTTKLIHFGTSIVLLNNMDKISCQGKNASAPKKYYRPYAEIAGLFQKSQFARRTT